MNVVNLAFKFIALKARLFEDSTRDPMKSQKRALFKYLSRNSKTEFGKKYNFSEIKSITEYQKFVPLTDYEKLYPYIERIKKGGQNILTRDKVTSFGLTSGTTGKQKFIPVTRYSEYRKADLMKLWTYYIIKAHPRAVSGKILAVIDPAVKNFTESGIPYGPESGRAYNKLPKIVRNFFALPYDIFYLKNYDARYYCILRVAMEHNVTTIATLNPSTLVLLCEKMEKWKDKIIDDIERGSLKRDFEISDNIRKIVEKSLRPNPKRARELKDIIKEKGKLLPLCVWPNLELLECWKGGTVKLYLKELPQYFGDVAIRDFGCLSTETRSSIPITDEGAGGILAIETNFYEFIPKEDIGKKEKRIFLCDQLEKGAEYLLIVTTPGGLYRYDIDDVIKVDGFFNKTPIIEFVQKGLNAISMTGEKVYESHVNEAVNKAAERHKLPIKSFSASVERAWPPRYIFLVEFENNPPLAAKKALLKSIEEELYRQNGEYHDLRNEQVLGKPILKVVKGGEFERYRIKRVGEGAHDTQFKIPELVADPNFQKNFMIEEEIFFE